MFERYDGSAEISFISRHEIERRHLITRIAPEPVLDPSSRLIFCGSASFFNRLLHTLDLSL